MNRLLQRLACACRCALGSAMTRAQAVDQTADRAATKARLDQVANSNMAGNAFMGIVKVVEGTASCPACTSARPQIPFCKPCGKYLRPKS